MCLVISYKCLIGSIKKNLKVFEKKIGKRGLKKLGNGHFIGQYKGLKDSIRSNLKIVRKADSVCDLPLLRIIYDDISKMEKMAIKEIPNINASKSESLSFWENMIRWILSIGISLVVGYLVYVFKR